MKTYNPYHSGSDFRKEGYDMYGDEMEDSYATAKDSYTPKILLIDDDVEYGKIMERIAKKNNTQLYYYPSLENVPTNGEVKFDAAIVDFDLGNITGLELTSYLETNCAQMIPVVLISHSGRWNSKRFWPDTIKDFVHKKLGPSVVLNTVHEVIKKNRSLHQ